MNPKKFYDLLIKSFDFVPTQDQIISIRKLTDFLSDDKKGKVFLLKGYAGTGKTSLVKVLIKNLMFKNLKYCLLAPTGRAAKVLSNYTKKNK